MSANSHSAASAAATYLMTTTMENMSMIGNFSNDTQSGVAEEWVSIRYDPVTTIIVGILLYSLSIWTAVGNLLVWLALYRFKNLQTISNYLIGNLALCDFLLAVTVLPMSSTVDMLGYWVFGEILCNYWLAVDVLCCTASIWSLTVIAFDRFTATSYPIWYREKRALRRVVVYIIFVWVLSTAICIPPIFGWHDATETYLIDKTINKPVCVLYQSPSYVMYSSTGSFYVPLFIMVFLYMKIFAVLRQRTKAARQRMKERGQLPKKQSSKRKSFLGNKDFNKNKQDIELSNIQTENGSGNTEELSSRSMFGSGDEDSCTESKSNNPLCYTSGSETVSDAHHKNGIKDNHHNLIIVNPGHTFSETDKEDANEKELQPLQPENHVTATDGSGTESGDGKDKKLIHKKPDEHNQNCVSKERKGLGNVLKNANPFKKHQKTMSKTAMRRQDLKEQRATKIMAIIMVCFIVCWMPFFLMYVIRSFCASCDLDAHVQTFIYWLGIANSGLNPILYTIFNEEFRRAFGRILGCYKNDKGKSKR